MAVQNEPYLSRASVRPFPLPLIVQIQALLRFPAMPLLLLLLASFHPSQAVALSDVADERTPTTSARNRSARFIKP